METIQVLDSKPPLSNICREWVFLLASFLNLERWLKFTLFFPTRNKTSTEVVVAPDIPFQLYFKVQLIRKI